MTHTFLERSELVPVVITCVIKERIKETVNWTTSVRKLILTLYRYKRSSRMSVSFWNENPINSFRIAWLVSNKFYSGVMWQPVWTRSWTIWRAFPVNIQTTLIYNTSITFLCHIFYFLSVAVLFCFFIFHFASIFFISLPIILYIRV